jgi:hypothetical protein
VLVSTPHRHLEVLTSRGNEDAAEVSSPFTRCLQELLLWNLLNDWSLRERSRGWTTSLLVRPHCRRMAHRVGETTFQTSAPVWDRWMTFSCGMIRRRNRRQSTLHRLLRLVRRKLALPLLLRTPVLLHLWRWMLLAPTRRLASRPMAHLARRMGRRSRQSTTARVRQWSVHRLRRKTVVKDLMEQRPRRMASLSQAVGRSLRIRPAQHRGLDP